VLDTRWAREDCSQKAGGLRGVEGDEKKRKDGEKKTSREEKQTRSS
jgi:hypothetical protein